MLALMALVGLVSSESYGFRGSSPSELRAGRLAREALDLAITERNAECASRPGSKCHDLRGVEEAKHTALGNIPCPRRTP